jgi:hypothetical protein
VPGVVLLTVKVATPLLSVLAVAGEIEMLPGVALRLTGTPAGTSALLVSRTDTETVALPPTKVALGETVTVELVPLTPMTLKLIGVVGVMVVLPTVAVKGLYVPMFALLTLKVATPLELVGAVLGETVTPDGAFSVTFTPAGTGLLEVSTTATVTVAFTFLKTLVGESVKLAVLLMPLTVKLTEGVMVTPSAIAVKLSVPGLALMTVKVATPLALVVPLPLIVTPAAGMLVKVTGTPAGTRLLAVSRTVTVTVAGAPMKTDVGAMVTVEFVPLTPMTLKLIGVVGVMVVLPTVALKALYVLTIALLTLKVATPPGPVVAVTGETVTPVGAFSVTFTPAGTGLLEVSTTATVIVAGAFLKTVVGESVKLAVLLTPLTVSVAGVSGVVPAVAVSVSVPALALVTVKVATPLEFVVVEAGVMVTPAEGELFKVTGIPAGTELLFVSFTVTVTVAGMPMKTAAGETATVELPALMPITSSATV